MKKYWRYVNGDVDSIISVGKLKVTRDGSRTQTGHMYLWGSCVRPYTATSPQTRGPAHTAVSGHDNGSSYVCRGLMDSKADKLLV